MLLLWQIICGNLRNYVPGVCICWRGSSEGDRADRRRLRPHDWKVHVFCCGLKRIWEYTSSKDKAVNVSRVKKSFSEGALRPSDLLAQFKQTDGTTRTQIRAAELLDNTVELIREMVYTNTMMQPNPYGTEQKSHTACLCTFNSAVNCRPWSQ